MTRRVPLFLGLLFWMATAAHAAEVTAPPKNVTLAGALRALPQSRLPDQGVVLTVAPEQVRLPASAQKPTDEAPEVETLETVVSAYNRSEQAFGHVIALAPPTMTVLNTDPNLANVPLADLVQKNPLPFLLGTLTEAQLHLLGTTGLGMDDLTADQQSLLQAVLPHPFQVVPKAAMPQILTQDEVKNAKPADWDKWKEQAEARQAQIVTLSDADMRGVRLQAHLAADYNFGVTGQSYSFMSVSPGGLTPPSGDGPYSLSDSGIPVAVQNAKLQNYLRAELPNELKDGDLRWTQHALDANFSLLGLHTVGELVARLATATRLELHCDSHYGGQSLLILGATDRPRSADEVMQALTLCVCGAWRQVGPGWVLTDDVQGVGTRQAMIKDIVAVWGNRLDKAAQAVGDHLNDLGWMRTLSFASGDPAALPASLQGTVRDKTGKSEGFGVPLAWKELPASLQSGLKQGLDDPEFRKSEGASAAKGEGMLGPDTPVYVEMNMKFAVSVPGYGTMPLMLGNEYRVPHSEHHGGPSGSSPQPRPKPVVLTEKTRGVLCAPSTPAQARQAIDRMAAMGFNALFCDVFTGGRTFFPNTVLPPASKTNAGVLAAAIAEGRAKGVTVYAVLDTLCWRTEGPDAQTPHLPTGFTEDMTLGGETFSENIRRRVQAGSLDPQDSTDFVLASEGLQRWISPADPQAQAVLPALVKTLAATPGLAGLVFQDTAAPGYLGGGDTGDPSAPEVGYTLANRVARVRTGAPDPIDVGGGRDTYVYFHSQDANASASLDMSLPTFSGAEIAVAHPWDQFRADADHALLASLYAAAHEAAPDLPLWMRERRTGFALDAWTDARQLNEATDLSSEGNALGKRATTASILAVTLETYARHNPNMLPDMIQQFRQVFGDGRAGGLLLDFQSVSPAPDPIKDLELVVPYFPSAAGK